MAKHLNPDILKTLSRKLNKGEDKIRPRLSELRRENSGLTLNAAAQLYATQQGISIMAKLDEDDKKSLATVQKITQISSTKTVKIDKRTVNINHSLIHNLSVGDRNRVSQRALLLDQELSQLFTAIQKSDLPDEQKEDFKSDLQSLASQVGKKEPNTGVIKSAWKALEKLATVEGCAELIVRLTPLIQHLIHH